MRSKPQGASQPQSKAQNNKERQNEKGSSKDSSDSDTWPSEKNVPSNITPLHKEGRDRPKSRLGHISPRGKQNISYQDGSVQVSLFSSYSMLSIIDLCLFLLYSA